MFTWPLVVTDSCYYKAMDSDIVLGCNMTQKLTLVLGSIISYSYQVDPHCPQVFSSPSLHCAHILLFLFLYRFSTTYLLLLVAPRVSECLGLSQEWSQEC